MGASNFSVNYSGSNMKEAYYNAVEEAKYESGNDAYNGTISTTIGFMDKTNEFKRSGMSINEFADKNLDKTEKWGDCIGVCIVKPKTNTNKIKSKVEHYIQKGGKKWETRYVVYNRKFESIGLSTKKGDAVKIARKYTEKHGERTMIDIEKHLVGGVNRVALITYKDSKTNPSIDGKYEFFGWAAE